MKLLLPALYPLTLCALSRDYHLPPTPLVTVSMYARVTLAVHVLSRVYHLPPTPLVGVSVYARVTLTLCAHCPGITTYYLSPTPLVRVSVHARVTLAVCVLSRDYHLPPIPHPPCQGIRMYLYVCMHNFCKSLALVYISVAIYALCHMSSNQETLNTMQLTQDSHYSMSCLRWDLNP